MSESRWIKTALFLVLQFTAAATGQDVIYVAVRDGDEVTLPCNSLMDDQGNCDSITWVFRDSKHRVLADFLFYNGKIGDEARDKSDRLSVTENCSLVLKNVTDEDSGIYICMETKPKPHNAQVFLSVVTMTEHQDADEVTVTCSVSTYGPCDHTVKWLYEGQDVDKDNKDWMTSQSLCSASLKALTSHFFNTTRFNSLTCEVTTGDKVQKFPLRISPSGDETGEDTTTTTTEDDTKAAQAITKPAISEDSPELQSWWRFIYVPVGLAALIIIVVAVVMWARIKEKKSQTDEIAVRYDAEDETVDCDDVGPPDGVGPARLPPSDSPICSSRLT